MSRSGKNMFIAVETLLLAGAIALSGGLWWKLKQQEPASVQASAKIKKQEIRIAKDVEIDHHYDLSGYKILLSNDTYGEVYLPVLENVPAFSKNVDQIATRNGRKYYIEDGKITSHLGVDVSAHQQEIDWAQVKASGIEFAMIRVGYRTYSGGKVTADGNFQKNIQNAQAAGIKVGAYFFSQAVSEAEAIEEAQFVEQALAGYRLEYPVVYDWELIYNDDARTDNIPVDTLTDSCIAFCDIIRSAGYRPMIYQNKRTSLLKLDLPRLQGIDFWLAEYGRIPTYYYDFSMWQYACKGKVPGIAGDVDMNISFTDYSES